MEQSFEQYAQIGRYVDSEMDEKEKASFEALLQRDKALQAEVQLYRDVQALSASASEKINDRLQQDVKKNSEAIWSMVATARKEWEARFEKRVAHPVTNPLVPAKTHDRKTGKIQRVARYVLAALFIGAISFITIRLQQKGSTPDESSRQPHTQTSPTVLLPKNDSAFALAQTPVSDTADTKQKPVQQPPVTNIDPAQLFAAYFTPDTVPSEKGTILEEPFAFYAAKKYAAAIETFAMAKAALHTRSESSENKVLPFTIYYYLGLSYLASGKETKSAITALKSALEASVDEKLKSKAQWYLALAYLQRGNVEETKKQLLQLISTGTASEYSQEAVQLLAQLNGT